MSGTTESATSRFAHIEAWSGAELVTGMVESQFSAVSAVQAASTSMAEAIERTTERLQRGGRLIYLGAGTSGRIAAQDAAELPPTFNWPHERAISLMAGGPQAMLRAAEGAEDNDQAAIKALNELSLSAKDVVLALAASGRTPYVVGAVVYGRSVGALTIGIFNNRGARLGEVAELPILLETGPEMLAGSTRMKAGTAQKVALNCISTGVMIRLGFVYRGLMVEMRPTNEKLRSRAIKIVAALADTDDQTAAPFLAKADGRIKLAVVMLVKALRRAEAEKYLASLGGNLAKALDKA